MFVSKIRSIIEKLIYEDIYDTIDTAMSDSNVGARRKRNIRDNLFVLYSTINEAIRNKKDIDIQFYDLAKCFDTMWAEETMNDLCTSCGLFQETQGHLLQCTPLVKNLNYLVGKTSKLNENDIYGSMEQQIQIVNIYSDILHERENLKYEKLGEDSPLTEGPVHPPNTMEVLQHAS